MTLIIGLVTLVLYSFTDLFVVLSAYIGQGLGFLVVALAGAWFPYRKRQIYEDSSARLSVGGLPLMTVAALPGAAFLAFILYRSFVDDTAAVNSRTTLLLTAAVFLIGIIWYFVAKAVQKRRGVDVDLRFDEIPVE